MLGIQEYVWSVFDVDRAIRPFVEDAGWTYRRLQDASNDQARLWGATQPYDCIEQGLLVPPDAPQGRCLRVVCFHGPDKVLIRPCQHIWDTGGICALDATSNNVRALFRRLQVRHGWTAWGEPVDYAFGDAQFTGVIAISPDGLALGLIETRGGESSHGKMSPVSWTLNSPQVVRDLEAMQTYYSDVLGWEQVAVHLIEDATEPGFQLLGIPLPIARDTSRTMAIQRPPGSVDETMELFRLSLQGADYSDRAHAPNVGILAARVLVEDAAAYAQEIESRGGQLLCGLTRIAVEPLGAITTFSVRTPEGSILEFSSLDPKRKRKRISRSNRRALHPD